MESDLVQLRVVIKICYKKEGLKQPSLSKAVMELEDELDTTLFIREKTGIRLTDDGSRFLVRARQVMEQMDLLEKEFAEPHDGKVRFSVASQQFR